MLETNVKIIKHKVGLLNLAEELGDVSRVCKTMGTRSFDTEWNAIWSRSMVTHRRTSMRD
jgi:hypothetical protein